MIHVLLHPSGQRKGALGPIHHARIDMIIDPVEMQPTSALPRGPGRPAHQRSIVPVSRCIGGRTTQGVSSNMSGIINDTRCHLVK